MSFKNGVLEGSQLDFGGPGLDFRDPEARFWRVLVRVFRDFGPLGSRIVGTDFDLEALAARF